ncbi:MAG: amidase, partial [Rhodothermales bacterium]
MTNRTFSDARRALDNGETGFEELVSSFLERIGREDDHLNAFISVDAEGAIERARSLDRQTERGPLAGMIVAVKDVICIKGGRVTCASKMLENFESLYDATVIRKLRDAGTIFIGKTNCDQFAMGSSSENSHFGPV